MAYPPNMLFEDDDLLVLNKPSGMLTEGGADREDDLEQWASRQAGKPIFCCHRLDRATSGVVLLRKNNRHNPALTALFEQRRIRKLYWAVVAGSWPPGMQQIKTQIAAVGPGLWANVATGGKPAVSTFQVLGGSPERNQTWLGILLKTGRTHQARLHCLNAGSPIIGDPVYGNSQPAGFFGLHARELRLPHPATQQALHLRAPAPANWPSWIAL